MRTGVSMSWSRSNRATASPNPPTVPLSSTVTTSLYCARGVGQRRVERLDPARVNHGHADALVGQPVGGLARTPRPSARPRPAARRPRRRPRARAARPCRRAAHRLEVLAERLPRGNRSAVGPSRHRHGFAQQFGQPGAVPRHRDPQARHQLEQRAVPHAVVAGAVRSGDPGPVQHESDRQPVHGHVHQHLVEGAVQEGRSRSPPPGAARPSPARPRWSPRAARRCRRRTPGQGRPRRTWPARWGAAWPR